jgi:hypothetical protein
MQAHCGVSVSDMLKENIAKIGEVANGPAITGKSGFQ